MKVKLEQSAGLDRLRRIGAAGIIPWASCLPFVDNSKAVLIHRPRSICTHKISSRWGAHIAIHCWCGNSMTGTKKFTFLEAPAEDRIVCARCEDNAVASGLLPSSAIAGRHVHTGGVIAKSRCCGTETPAVKDG
jgi:hypothetical protein